MRLTVKEIGARHASRRFARIASRAQRTRPAMSDVADVVLEGEREHWRNPGWEPLAASTRARKRREGLPSRPLRATGTLERALTRRGARGQLLRVTGRDVVFGLQGGRAPAFYGRFHQAGQGVPKREVLVMTARTRRRMARAVGRHLMS